MFGDGLGRELLLLSVSFFLFLRGYMYINSAFSSMQATPVAETIQHCTGAFLFLLHLASIVKEERKAKSPTSSVSAQVLDSFSLALASTSFYFISFSLFFFVSSGTHKRVRSVN